LLDSTDNAIDISNAINNLNGFIPLVAPITEPALGYGAVLGSLYFIPKKRDSAKSEFKMPDVTGAAGGLTANKTWFVGAGYAGFWKDDHIRYRGAFGYGDVKLTYYGEEENNSEYSVGFRLTSYFLLQQAIFRIRNTHFLLGGKYQLMKNHTSFEEDVDLPDNDYFDHELLNSGIGAIAEYEHFNNLFSPTKGLRINLTYTQYLQAIGSDRDFGLFLFFAHFYQPIIKNNWTAGFRVESQFATGDPPFYMYPFINLRGVPLLRYQGELTALIETEQEVMLSRRWSVVGFGGYGWAFRSVNDNIRQSTAWNAGTGFRYMIARLFGLKMGMDIARGPEDWAIYVVFGSAWIK